MTVAAADTATMKKMETTELNLTKSLLTIIVVYLTFHLYLAYRKRRKMYAYMDYFPGDKWYPFIGSTWRFLTKKREDHWDALKQLFIDHGPTVRIWAGSFPRLWVTKPEHLEIMFRHNVNINKSQEYHIFRPWLGNGLLVAGGQQWKTKRRLFTSAFHFKILDQYSKVFYEKSKELATYLDRYGGEHFDILPIMTRCGMDILAETAMGVKFNSLQDSDADYGNAISRICAICLKRIRSPWMKNDFLFNNSKFGKEFRHYLQIINDTNLKIISERRVEFEKLKHKSKMDDCEIKEKQAFLDILLENAESLKMTDLDMCEEVSTFMFTGQDTTAATVAYALMALGNYPEIQEKVHEELDSVIGRDLTRPINSQDIAELDYLDRVIRETLRKFTFVPFMARRIEETIRIDGQAIPPGVTVMCNLYGLHHDPEQWPNPDLFDPDRFLPEICKTRHPYSFAPFSAGARNCIGQKFGLRNTKIILSTLLRKFKVSCPDDPNNVKQYVEIILRPQNGIHVKLEKRS